MWVFLQELPCCCDGVARGEAVASSNAGPLLLLHGPSGWHGPWEACSHPTDGDAAHGMRCPFLPCTRALWPAGDGRLCCTALHCTARMLRALPHPPHLLSLVACTLPCRRATK